MPSFLLRAFTLFGLSLMISACSSAAGQAKAPGEVGKTAPALAIQSLNGKGTASLASASGKVLVVQFWATWCERCKTSLGQLEQLSKQSGGRVEAIGISVDDTSKGVADFAKAQGVTFPIAWDENHTLMWRWSVEKMPSTYVLDSKGMVRFVHDTTKDEGDAIAREVAELANDGPVTSPKIEVASASVPVPVAPVVAPAPATDTPPASATEEASAPAPEVTASAKPRGKAAGAKKNVIKKTTTKKSSAPQGKATAI